MMANVETIRIEKRVQRIRTLLLSGGSTTQNVYFIEIWARGGSREERRRRRPFG